jgi:pyruvate kinase
VLRTAVKIYLGLNESVIMAIKIISTLGPTSFNTDIIHELDLAGTDIFRINLSHTSLEQCDKIISTIRSVSSKAICLDTEGPQVRVGKNIPDIYLKQGDKVSINSRVSDLISIPLNYEIILKEGETLSIGMHKLVLKVISTAQETLAEVIIPGLLSKNKAVCIPHFDLSVLPLLSTKDEAALKLLYDYDISYLTCSYVRDEQDVKYLLERLNDLDISIIPKIELKQSVNAISPIFDLVDTVLIDRGDLSKETSLFEVPFLQRKIFNIAHEKRKQVFLATHLMEHTLSSEEMPTIAEISDIYSLIQLGVSGFVFAQETAIGTAPVEVVKTLKQTIDYFYQHHD